MEPDLEPELEVVLATWNGALFLEQQLRSLEQQTLRPSRVLVHDDGSSDATLAILQRWAQAHPGWLELLPPLPQRLGPAAAFNRLLLASRAPYVALCDQDDIWHPERLAAGLSQLRQVEAAASPDPRPLLLHSDARQIDDRGRPLGHSLWQWHRASAEPPGLVKLSQRNRITGCTLLSNRALLQRALPIPEDAVLHDWWLALVACQHQGLLACPRQLLDHRRHGGNASGQAPACWQQPLAGLQRGRAVHGQWRRLHQRFGIPWQQRLIWWPLAVVHALARTLPHRGA